MTYKKHTLHSQNSKKYSSVKILSVVNRHTQTREIASKTWSIYRVYIIYISSENTLER